MARTCIDVPQMSGKAHLKSVQATAHYGQGTGNDDVLIAGVVLVGLALIVLACALWTRWI